MAGSYLLCAIFVVLNILEVRGTVRHVKGLICQDPDTRKLYPINSTWPSVSFCGNYTCRLRQKNLTQTEYAPVTKINITDVGTKGKSLKNDMDSSPSDQIFDIIKKEQRAQPVYLKEPIDNINEIKDKYKIESDTDRYLTDSEIKAIAEILHTVKKSDLEAIVEIYNIAQDIYKEMDTDGNKEEKSVKDIYLNSMKSKQVNFNKKNGSKTKQSVSYWYEPLHQDSMKLKPTDLKFGATNAVPITKSYSNPYTYFQGHPTDKSFRKLPYYYPLPNIYRPIAYDQNKASQNAQNNRLRHGKTCRKKFSNIEPTWVNTHTNSLKPELGKPQNIMQLLPYPFSYVPHYNFNEYPASFLYSHYPWAQLNAYNRVKNYPPHLLGAYTAQVPNAANNEEIKQKSDIYNVHSEENNDSMNKIKEVSLPEWQTEQLSDKVIEEVKANILEDSILKPLNLVRNIKLEKVGKVIKLDELTRTKREIDNIDYKDTELHNVQYEPFIEKTTCESSTEPGFFQLGNMQEPFPACCPQKIISS